jgi:hypothetical protein
MRSDVTVGSAGAAAGADSRLAGVLRRAPLLDRALRAARAVDAPDWLICAGAIRDAVWDDLHGRPLDAVPADIDLAFFDPSDLSPARERAVQDACLDHAPGLPWQAKNQAAVHLWYPERFGLDVEPFSSSAEAVATFPETASCVGVRLLDDDDGRAGDGLVVVAPYGLDDLLGCVCRHNPARVPRSFYEQRVAATRWRERWPLMRYVPPDG